MASHRQSSTWGPPIVIACLLGAMAVGGPGPALCAEEPATAAKGDVKPAPTAPSTSPGESTGAPGALAEKAETKTEKSEPKEKGGEESKGKSDNPSGEKGKAEESPQPVQRPAAPPTAPKPEEMKVRPDADGKVRFNFHGQPWSAVLEWLAEISGMSLDWQELPGDYLNLSTQRSYTIAEARSLVNRHLLARGYTLLEQGEVLSVANVKKLDPSLVPRLEPEELARHDKYGYAKVSFPLDTLLASAAVEELKPMLSPNGKLVALSESNRLEAMDAVANLCEIYAVLKDQQSDEIAGRSVREFQLKYARASEVSELLEKLLEVEGKPNPLALMQPGQNPEQQAMMARMQAQASGGQPPGQPGQAAPGGKTRSPLALAVDDRRNSILVRTTPDKMAVVAKVIEAVDIPLSHDDSLLTNLNRMQVYRLPGVDAEPVVKTLREIGNLDPATRLEVDKKNHAIIAYAPLADHVTIRAVVEKLAGSERKFEVIRLRRLSADYVAGTIEFMMGGGKKEKPRSTPFFWDSSRREPEEEAKGFRVDADVENNRLLLWATDVELSEVENLLAKLGEIPAKGGNPETTRILDGGGGDPAELLEQLRQAWPAIAPNPLLIRPANPAEKPAEGKTDGGERPVPVPEPKAKESSPEAGRTALRLLAPAVVPVSEVRGRVKADREPAAAPPPVSVTVTPDGKLIVTSDDTQALDRLEELAARLSTPRRGYKVYSLKYAWAGTMTQMLQDFFKEEKKERSRPTPWWYYDYGMQEEEPEEDDRRLSKRRKLRFIADSETNTILVDGADADQLRTIEELIQLYDRPAPTDAQSARRTQVFQLQHAKATVVADAVKDVFRDLLSVNDKALAPAPGQAIQPSPRPYEFSRSDSGNTEQKTPKFKGLLSIGVDEVSNTLVVSAPAYLFEQVARLIEELDLATEANHTVRVLRLAPGVSPSQLKDAIDAALGHAVKKPATAPAVKPAKPAAPAKGK